ncbi:MAG: hypothetical protein R8G34_18725 [Paracoccaceae bacterium]|nr:hypothetical protein [Paracoccaceae bacterium]
MVALAKQFLSSTSIFDGSLIAFAIIAFYAHRAILLDERLSWRNALWRPSKDAQPIKMGPFLWRMFGWWTFAAAVWAFCFLALRRASFLPDQNITPDESAGLIFVGLILTVVITLPVLAAFGTMFPAAAVEGSTSLGSAWRRGRKSFWRALGRLWGGNILFFVISSGVLLWLLPETGSPVMDGVMRVPFELVGIFAICLTAAALSLAYIEDEFENSHAPDQTDDGPLRS